MMKAMQYYRALQQTVGGFGPILYTPPLDLYSAGIFAAWSPVRKLRTAYAGSAVRMIDSASNEVDIPFRSDGIVDIDFVVAESISRISRLRVVKIYDQSGNGNDIVTTQFGFYTENDGPIYTPYVLNGKSTLTRTNYTLATSAFTNNGLKSYFSVGAGRNANFRDTIGTRVGQTGWLLRITSTAYFYAVVGGASYSVSETSSLSAQLISAFTYGATNLVKFYKNGALLGTSGAITGGTSTSMLSNADGENNDFQEKLLYSSDKTTDAIAIQTNQNAFYGTY